MGILRYIIKGHPHSNIDIFNDNHEKRKEKFEKKLTKFMQSRRTVEVLNEYNFDPDKLKDIIMRSYYSGIYNIIFILNRGKFLRGLLDIYTKAPDDWSENAKYVKAHNFLNKYNIYK